MESGELKELPHGIFTISLDFELFWGVRDQYNLESYGGNIEKVHEIVPELLKLFTSYDVHCSWATVGFLFYQNEQDLKLNLPSIRPNYLNSNLSPYTYLQDNKLENKYHFGLELIKQISKTQNQEIATHTFSHFYCLEDGITTQELEEDLSKAIELANQHNIKILSVVFPRNQYNVDVLKSCKKLGIKTYRGNPQNLIYAPLKYESQSLLKRSLRLIDSYVNIMGYKVHNPEVTQGILNIPASMFLRPYSKSLAWLEKLKLIRIKRAMYYAARNSKVFHLWWHPHNFGSNTLQNLLFLEEILKYYTYLKKNYKMQSMNMGEIASLLD